jgi:tRNA(Ile)-lysidine synthase
MEIKLQPGRYVVAVSGGVDSVVLLDMLQGCKDMQLVVAHFDHGIRPDSADDAEFVRQLASKHGLPFITERVELGDGASEATAREARYIFLRQAVKQTDSQAIVTAHHQDDLLETAIFNILRGTSRRGLASLQSTSDIQRPLLHVPKNDLQAYALQHHLSWREDTTNRDERYTRNYIRHRLLVKFDTRARQQLLALIEQAQDINKEVDPLLNELLVAHTTAAEVDRRWFKSLPHTVAREVMAAWLRQNRVADFDRKTIERLTVQAKVKPVGKRLDVLHNYQLHINKESLALELVKR